MDSHILIVDDNRDLAESLSELLDIEGHSTDIAYNVSEAINFLDSRNYSFCITDIKLPDGNGLDVYNHARDRIDITHIIPITGYRLEQTVSEIFRNTGQSYINLDFSPESITGILDRSNGNNVTLVSASKSRDLLSRSSLESRNVEDFFYITETDFDINSLQAASNQIVIIDLNVPVIQILSLAYDIYKTCDKSHIVILLPEAVTGNNNFLQTFEATGMLFKPFKTDLFLSILDNYINQQSN